jgi:acetyl-CoA C-acetyltransferase
MPIDPRTPVLVGAAAVTQRAEDPRELSEPLELMAEALERAAEDAGSKSLLTDVDSIWAPRGFWEYSDPGRLLAERFGAADVRTVVAEIGVLQTSVLGLAATEIAEGRCDIAMIVGAEARDRASRLKRQGLEVPLTRQSDSQPDEVLRPAAEIMGKLEIELGLVTPVIQYSMIDNALRAHEGQSIDDHRRALGDLWAGMSRVAAGNDHAWNRDAMSSEAIREANPSNRMLAFPYTKWLVSQWNVNQAGGLVLCSYEKAKRLGLDERRFVFPLAVVDSNRMVTLSERRELHRSPGFRFAGERAAEHLDRGLDEIDHLEIYSCFPAAVRVQQRELGLGRTRSVTQTGGMTFGGGPLNNFVLQGWVGMIECLRADPGALGLVTAISGLITKQGVSVLGPEPSPAFLFADVSDAVDAEHRPVHVEADAAGRGRVASYTVGRIGAAESGVAIVVDLDDGQRTLRVLDDGALAERGMRQELCGRAVEVTSEGGVEWLE